MCGRFTLRTSASVIAEQFGLFEVPGFAARFNIAPSQPVPVIRMRAEPPQGSVKGDSPIFAETKIGTVPRELVWLRWGLVPSWAKDPAIGSRLINARAETAAEKPAFRMAMRRRRCLIVADGFYEWQRGGRKKQPYFIHLREDRTFAFAGVWEAWEGADHSTLETCAILTTAANELVSPLHDRMPVILCDACCAAWLDPAVEDPRQLAPLLRPYASDEMQAHPVGDFVNSPTHDSPRCIEPALQKSNMTLPGM
jgi:putative SOS response-associated peptidase YedK